MDVGTGMSARFYDWIKDSLGSKYSRKEGAIYVCDYNYQPRGSLAFTHALKLPTFTVEGMTLMKRLTLVVRNNRIEHVFYPVFPPDKHADEVIAWLKANRT